MVFVRSLRLLMDRGRSVDQAENLQLLVRLGHHLPKRVSIFQMRVPAMVWISDSTCMEINHGYLYLCGHTGGNGQNFV